MANIEKGQVQDHQNHTQGPGQDHVLDHAQGHGNCLHPVNHLRIVIIILGGHGQEIDLAVHGTT